MIHANFQSDVSIEHHAKLSTEWSVETAHSCIIGLLEVEAKEPTSKVDSQIWSTALTCGIKVWLFAVSLNDHRYLQQASRESRFSI